MHSPRGGFGCNHTMTTACVTTQTPVVCVFTGLHKLIAYHGVTAFNEKLFAMVPDSYPPTVFSNKEFTLWTA